MKAVCSNIEIKSYSYQKIEIFIDNIESIDDISEVLECFTDDELNKYITTNSLLANFDDSELLKYVSEDSIIDKILNNRILLDKLFENIEESEIISLARKIKIDRLIL